MTALITRGIHLLILTRELPREPLRWAADPLQGVGGIQHPALRRAVEYLDRRLTGLRAVKSIAGTYLSVDFTTDVNGRRQNSSSRSRRIHRRCIKLSCGDFEGYGDPTSFHEKENWNKKKKCTY